MTEVFVVGGHGYVGSRLARAADDIEGSRARLVAVSRRGDTRDGVVSRPFGELPGVVGSHDDAAVVWLLEHKHDEQELLAELLPALEASSAKLVLASTCTVYGDRGDEMCNEQTVINPRGNATHKAHVEELVRDSHVRHCVLRLGVLYGEDPTGRRADRALKMVRAGHTNGVVEVAGAMHWRGWLHRDQAARAFYRAAVGAAGGLFVVASENRQLGQVAQRAADLSGAIVRATDAPDPYSYRLNSARARSEGLLDQRDGESLWSVMGDYAEV